jgi:type I restriction enzyme S subunit
VYRRAVLEAAVAGELTRDWREMNAPNETGEDLLRFILNERRKAKRNRGTGPLVIDAIDLSILPAGWTWATVDQLTNFFGNGLSKPPYAQPPGAPILRISAVRPLAVNVDDRRYYREPLADEAEIRAVQSDLLFTRYNGSKHLVGVCGLMRSDDPILYPDKIMRARPVLPDKKLAEYMEIALNCGASRSFIDRNIKTTAGQQGIAGSTIRRCPVPLPPLSEAHRIVDSVWSKLAEAEQLEAALARLAADGVRARQSILRTAFSGRLIPQNMSDEPASALVERMRVPVDGSHGNRRKRRSAVGPEGGRRRSMKAPA